MEINQVSKMLAYSFVSELIKSNKLKKKIFINSSLNDDLVDTADVSFGDLEEYYKKVLTTIENTPEIRHSIVDALKAYQESGGDLNEFYPAKLIASEESLQKNLFFD
ncbi:MAG: hypothetical protein RLZZ361_1374 [Cyanobacteriota bacterium]|jgi:hypothetical protein